VVRTRRGGSVVIGQALNRRSIALALLAWTASGGLAVAASPPLEVAGRFVQGGFAIGRTAPRAEVLLDGEAVGRASANGLFVVGFDRDGPASARVTVRAPGGEASREIQVGRGVFDIQRIDGLPQDQVAPSDPALLARIRAEAARKAEAFESQADLDAFSSGFVLPLDRYRVSGRFGGQRILNGEPRRPHYGVDMAAPVGTPVRAPAGGVVAFAEQGLHFEGALILIDHGQGLISMYLHLSRVDVRKGETVRRGQVIGAVGKEGRATGPHLCWRLKWRGRNLDPSLLVGAMAP
jgi:murein DD-endopeptidase MepM/ murein hydrolase activator NlpD